MTRDEYSQAFYEQARSDWDIYKLLAGDRNVRACHALHYLQMSCEKLAKAYRLREPNLSTLEELTSGHTGFVSFVKAFLRSSGVVADYKGKTAAHQSVCKGMEKFAREVERLAPSVDSETYPENSEYPWEKGGRVIVPCEYDYSSLNFLEQTAGRTFLKLIQRAFDDYSSAA